MMPKYYIMLTDVSTETKRGLFRTVKTIRQSQLLEGCYETFEEAKEAYDNLSSVYFDKCEHVWVDCFDPTGGYYKLAGSMDDDHYLMAVLYTYKKVGGV